MYKWSKLAAIYFYADGSTNIIPVDTIVFTLPNEITPATYYEFPAFNCINYDALEFKTVILAIDTDRIGRIKKNNLSRGAFSCIIRLS